MSGIPASLRNFVIDRAGNRCEYCHLSQKGQEATFHIDHIVPVIAGGETAAENLALACVSCSLRKGAKQMVFDSETKQEVHLFNPRLDDWNEHFEWQAVRLIGLTPKGRAMVDALNFNRPLILAIREEETFFGRHPK